MNVDFPIEFFPKQRNVILSDAYENLVDGNKGSGKTLAIVSKIYYDCMKHRNINWIFFRRTLPEARETFLKYALQAYPKGTYVYKVAQNRIVFPTGSNCLLGHIENDKDLLKYQGFSFHRAAFDEATSFTPKQIGYIKAQIRSDKRDVPSQIFYSTNPGGISHGWFKNRFVDGHVSFTKYETPESAARRKFKDLPDSRAIYLCRHNLMLDDNKYLMESDPDYITRLHELPEEDKPALLYGSWDILAGQFFKFKPEHKIVHYKPTVEDNIFIACDWGSNKPFSVGWYALRKDDHLIRYREYYGISSRGIPDDGCNMTAEEVACKIIEMTPMDETIKYMILDRACWIQGGHGISIKEIMQNILRARNIFLVQANNTPNSRVNGWEAVKKYMSVDENNNEPFLQITADCHHFWRTAPYMIYDALKQGDLDTRSEDHCCDELSYMVGSRPLPQRIVKSAEAPIGSMNWYKKQGKRKRPRIY